MPGVLVALIRWALHRLQHLYLQVVYTVGPSLEVNGSHRAEVCCVHEVVLHLVAVLGNCRDIESVTLLDLNLQLDAVTAL